MIKRAGILALQGDFEAHLRVLEILCGEVVLVRRPEQLESIGMLVMPGGESTTMSLLLDHSGLREPLAERISSGLPVLATCAGAILLSRELDNDSGSIRVNTLGLLDCRAGRNAFGRQVQSFEADLAIDWDVLGLSGETASFKGVFIRAPQLLDPGKDVRIAANWKGIPCLVRQNNIVAATFHPELSGSSAIHRAVAEFS